MTAAIEQTLDRLDQLNKEEEAAFYQQLKDHINWLINNNFSQLVQMLYRLDIDEDKLRSLLQNQQDIDAATLITHLIIERQLKKVKAGNQTKNDDDSTIPSNERW